MPRSSRALWRAPLRILAHMEQGFFSFRHIKNDVLDLTAEDGVGDLHLPHNWAIGEKSIPGRPSAAPMSRVKASTVKGMG